MFRVFQQAVNALVAQDSSFSQWVKNTNSRKATMVNHGRVGEKTGMDYQKKDVYTSYTTKLKPGVTH
jgi:hypothetical protein